MRALSNLATVSLLLIPFSLIALGAAMVIIPDQQETIEGLAVLNDELQAQIESQKIIIADLARKLEEAENSITSQNERLALLDYELKDALAKNKKLSVRNRTLEIQIPGMNIAEKAAPFLQFLSVSVLLAFRMIKKELRPSTAIKASKDENTVMVHMTREQVKEYSKWRRNEKR